MQKTERLLALDALRGITIAAMIMVNQPGSWSYKYAQMCHAPWNGCTITDLIFPFFLIITGVSCWFAFQKYEQKPSVALTIKIFRRTLLMFLIGLLLNFFKQWMGTGEINLSELRISGVLQRIALCYGIGSALCLSLKPKTLLITSAVILLGYWVALWIGGGADPYLPENTIVGKIDIALLGKSHLRQGHPVDPSGLFASIPAITHIIYGYLLGMTIYQTNDRNKLILRMFIIGIPTILLAQMWDYVFPINKTLWTSSYVLYTSGWAFIALAFLIWIMDIKKKHKFFIPFFAFGVNPLFAYVFAELWASIISKLIIISVEGNPISLKVWIFEHIFAPFAGNMNGSLLYSVFIMFFYWSILWFLYKKKIYIKI